MKHHHNHHPPQFICGSMVEADGYHALRCRRCTGRFETRHHTLNDLVRKAFVSGGVKRKVLELPGLSRFDDKRPHRLTFVPRKHGRCILLDATCVSTVYCAASHISRMAATAARRWTAAEDATQKTLLKYASIEPRHVRGQQFPLNVKNVV